MVIINNYLHRTRHFESQNEISSGAIIYLQQDLVHKNSKITLLNWASKTITHTVSIILT